MGGGPNQYSMPGLPLGIYTNHWHRTVNMPGSGSCKAKNTDQGGRCARATEYSADFDNDLQGLFEVSDQPFSDNFMLLWILWNPIFTTYPPNPILAHCSKSSFLVQKFNFDFPRKFGGKTRENVVVLDFLAVDNFDFMRKIVKKNLGEKLVKMLWFWTF